MINLEICFMTLSTVVGIRKYLKGGSANNFLLIAISYATFIGLLDAKEPSDCLVESMVEVGRAATEIASGVAHAREGNLVLAASNAAEAGTHLSNAIDSINEMETVMKQRDWDNMLDLLESERPEREAMMRRINESARQMGLKDRHDAQQRVSGTAFQDTNGEGSTGTAFQDR